MNQMLCVLCGVRPASTGQGDHLPPKSLYTIAERKAAKFKFHTVPACVKCNGGGSKDDEALKMFICLETGEYRSSSADVIDAMGRTIGNNRRLATQIFNTARKVSAFDHQGLVQSKVAVSFDAESYKRAISRIARGMYWRMTSTILEPGARIEVHPLRQFGSEIVRELQGCAQHIPHTEVNGGSLRAKLIYSDGTRMLIIQFFGKHTAVALISM